MGPSRALEGFGLISGENASKLPLGCCCSDGAWHSHYEGANLFSFLNKGTAVTAGIDQACAAQQAQFQEPCR